MIKIILPFEPRTKKNSQQIFRDPKGRPFVTPSKAYKQYLKDCMVFLSSGLLPRKLNGRYNIKCLYYMKTRRSVDLNNLLEATCDALTHYNILEDDNSKIVAGHDGSRVLYDKEYPRTEIFIEVME